MILAVIIFGFLLRAISLNQSFWLDEATSGLVVRNFNLGEIITKFSPGDFHPPLYYLILKIWSYVFGTSEIALRFPSIVFGLLTIYLVYLIGKELFNKKVGLIAGSFLTTSGLHIYYSQEARMYSLVTLLVSYLVYLFLKKRWFLFSIILLLIGMTDYPALLIIPVFLVVGRKEWRKLVLSSSLLVISYLIWLPILFKQLSVGLSTVGSSWGNLLGAFSLKNFALIPVKFILGRISFDNKYLYASIVVIAAFLFGYLILKSTRRVNFLIWTWLLVPLVLGIIISCKLSILSYFRFLFVLPAFYLLVACGISTLKKPWLYLFFGFVLATNLLASSYYLFSSIFHREDWRSAAGAIEKDQIIFPADSQKEALIYYGREKQIITDPTEKEIWLSRYVWQIFDPEDKVRYKIEGLGYEKTAEYDFNGVVVWKYNK